MEKYRINPANGLEFGLYTLGDHLPDPATGKRIPAAQRLKEIIELARLAEQAGIEFFSVGESHQEYFTTQAHSVVLSAIAQATERIKVSSSSTILSTLDPVRVFEDFATIDLISGGRAEIIAGRASRVGNFGLLGFDLIDYEALFEEKFELLLQINASGEKPLSWSGTYRAPLEEAVILPRPLNGSLPIWRAVGGTPASAAKAGMAGVPMMLAMLGGPVSSFKRTIELYREAARRSGNDPDQLPVGTTGFFHTAPTTQQALREMHPHIDEGMKLTNGRGFHASAFMQGGHPHNVMCVGSPQEVIDKILYQAEVFGHQRYIGQMDFGGVPFERMIRNIDTIGEVILPAVKKYTRQSSTT